MTGPPPGLLVPADLDGQRLVDVGWARLGAVARRAVGPLIAAGGVTVDGVPGTIAERVRTGQRLALVPAELARLEAAGRVTPPSERPLEVAYEDERVLVVDKPSGVHVHPMGPHRWDTLLGGVLWHAGARPGSPWTAFRPSPAHRLDRPTSGLVLFAKSIAVREVLQGLLEQHQVVRTYQALVEGVPSQRSGTIELPLGRDPADDRRRAVVAEQVGGLPARSRFEVLDARGDTALLQLVLETGRTHQLRAHLAHVGHPILGDVLYGAAPLGPPPDPTVGGVIALRAVALELPDPAGGGRRLRVHTRLPRLLVI